jgi:hypothetical protein
VPAVVGLPFPGAKRPCGAASILGGSASRHLGGGRWDLAWQRPAGCVMGVLAQVEAADGGGARVCRRPRWWWTEATPPEISADDGGLTRRRHPYRSWPRRRSGRLGAQTAPGGAGQRQRGSCPWPRSEPNSGWTGPAICMVSGTPGRPRSPPLGHEWLRCWIRASGSRSGDRAVDLTCVARCSTLSVDCLAGLTSPRQFRGVAISGLFAMSLVRDLGCQGGGSGRWIARASLRRATWRW